MSIRQYVQQVKKTVTTTPILEKLDIVEEIISEEVLPKGVFAGFTL